MPNQPMTPEGLLQQIICLTGECFHSISQDCPYVHSDDRSGGEPVNAKLIVELILERDQQQATKILEETNKLHTKEDSFTCIWYEEPSSCNCGVALSQEAITAVLGGKGE